MAEPATALDSSSALSGVHGLHNVLQKLSKRETDIAAAASARDLSALREAAASLVNPQQDANALHLQDAQLHPAVLSCAELLVQQLLEPFAELYSSYGGSPCETPTELQIPGLMHQEILACKLQLLSLLLQHLGSVQFTVLVEHQAANRPGPIKDDGREHNRPTYVAGIVEIIEEDPTEVTADQLLQTQLQQLVLQALLVSALYAPPILSPHQTTPGAVAGQSSISSGDTSSADCSSATTGSCSLERYCTAVIEQGLELFTPWSGQQCQQEAFGLLQQVAEHVTVVNDSSSSKQDLRTQQKGKGQQPQQQQQDSNTQQLQQEGEGVPQQEWVQRLQQLLHVMLPQLLDSLRDPLLAQHRHRRVQDKGDLVPYKGPDTYHRCLAARQAAWIIQQLNAPLLDQDTNGLLLPAVLATSDDPAPAVQQYGHAMLSWMAVQCQAGSLRWQRVLLLDEAKRLVVGCEKGCWRTAMPAATNLVMAVESKHDVRSAGYHTLVQELITEAERNAHNPQQRLIFMVCLARLLPCLGLYIVRYFAQLMPLLLEWTHAYDQETTVVALQVLASVIRHSWPRIAVHSAVLWEHLVEVVSSADARAWMDDSGREQQGLGQQQQQQRFMQGSAVVDAAIEVAQLLVQVCGDRFRAAVQATAAEVEGGAQASKSVMVLLQKCNQ